MDTLPTDSTGIAKFPLGTAKLPGIEGLNMADFAVPVTGVSLIVALTLLSSPRPFLEMFRQRLADSHMFWIVGGVASIVNIITFVISLRERFSARHIWTTVALISATWVALTLSLIYVSGDSSSPGPPSTHAIIALLARYYFTFVTAIFLPCPLLIEISKAVESIFDKDSQDRDRPAPLPS